ncbi:uncharacterized protein LOC117120036 [Anneissia japonica]|uniref:uncharacterized protein LOC117120036 n=1 Tax=Anneissia japonica TaxID=1529436 RepID=UPI0014256DF3|nr:uncharacterized protein LOC117120036 [Anneissia japonica]
MRLMCNAWLLYRMFFCTVRGMTEAREQIPVMVKYWRKLDKEGILEECLVRYLWKNELTGSHDHNDVFEDCIELMKTFGLLFEKNAPEEDTRLFVVPSRMKTMPNNRLEIKKDNEQTVSIYVTPKDFLPDAVYDVLVVRFVSLSQDRGCRGDPKLFQNKAEIIFDDKHCVRLGRIFIDNKQSLKLEISRMKERDEQCVDKPTCKPHPSVCTEVLNMLKQNLDEVYPSKKVVGYSLNILCFVCVNPETPHFQELEYCLKNEYINCDKTGELIVMPTAKVQNLFVADSPVDNKRKISDSDQLVVKKFKTCNTTDGEKGSAEELLDFSVLKAVVSSWYDRHRSLSMLKVLFRDKVDNHKLSQVNKTMNLLNNLITYDHLSSRNLGLLCDTIRVTKHLGLLKEIKEKLPSFPDVREGNISTKFTPHRQKLMEFGMILTPSDVTQIDELYNTPPKDYTDGWEMITDLEDRLIIMEENMNKFIDLLKILNLSLAVGALTT